MEVESSDLQRPPAFNCTYEGGCNVGQESRRRKAFSSQEWRMHIADFRIVSWELFMFYDF
jgi:hypothetical protein